MKPEIDVEGLNEAIGRIRKSTSAMEPQHLEKVLMKGAKIVKAELQRRIGSQFKVKTGNLSASARAKKGSRRFRNFAMVFAAIDRARRKKAAPHAQLLERGTSKMPARPFFRPAVEATQNEVANVVNAGVRDLLERVK